MALGFRLNRERDRSLSAEPRRLFLFAFAATIFAGGCSAPSDLSSQLTVQHEISPRPASVGPVTVTLVLLDARAQPVTGARVRLEADMSHPGMAPQFAEARELGTGRYQAPLSFAMAGDWVVLLHIAVAGGKRYERELAVPGVLPQQGSR
jgi:hypothetical protein